MTGEWSPLPGLITAQWVEVVERADDRVWQRRQETDRIVIAWRHGIQGDAERVPIQWLLDNGEICPNEGPDEDPQPGETTEEPVGTVFYNFRPAQLAVPLTYSISPYSYTYSYSDSALGSS